MSRADIFQEIDTEREAQDKKWGVQDHAIIHHDEQQAARGRAYYQMQAEGAKMACAIRARQGDIGWNSILLEEIYEALAEKEDAKIRAELVQVAAVAVSMIECLDRKARKYAEGRSKSSTGATEEPGSTSIGRDETPVQSKASI